MKGDKVPIKLKEPSVKQKKILELWDKLIVEERHLSYEEIAKKVGVHRSFVFKVIKKYRKSV